MTAVQIGNYGVNDEDTEATDPEKPSGFVVRELSPVVEQLAQRTSRSAPISKKYGIPASVNRTPGFDQKATGSRAP